VATLLYSPGVTVHIQTAGHGIIDVTDDLESGTLTLAENQPSTFTFTLLNHARKYDGIFTPNDTISVRMKRIRWLPVFSGYLDQVPYFSVYPRSVQLKATDTLKRLKFRLWDPGAPESVALLAGKTVTRDAHTKGKTNFKKQSTDGGLRDIMVQVLDRVGEWPLRSIHIGRIPEDWTKRMEKLATTLASQTTIDPSILGLDGVSAGTTGTAAGSTTAPPNRPSGSTGNQTGGTGSGKGTGALPATRATVSDTPSIGDAVLTGENYANPRDPWLCDMQWPFAERGSLGYTAAKGLTQADYEQAVRWWANRLLLVTNPKNNKSVVVRAVGYGPASGSGICLSPRAQKAVGTDRGGTVTVRFAPTGSRPGPVSGSTSTSGGRQVVEEGQGSPKHTPTVPGSSGAGVGERLTSDEGLRPHVRAARSFIHANWNISRGIGGYAPRAAVGVGVSSDHFQGLALDVVVAESDTAATGSEFAQGEAIAGWFAANPLVFGTKYVIWHDKINFGQGWQSYGRPDSEDDIEQHRDHVHISFDETPMPIPAPVVQPNPYDDPDFDGIQDLEGTP
jgi:hypothetical protein